MFQLRWLRRLIRRNTQPIPTNKAVVWKQRLSVAYMILAWNAFGLVCYMLYTGRRDWAETYGYKTDADKYLSPGQQWAKTLKMDHAKIIRISSLGKISEVDTNTATNNEELE